jgi:RNA polymerase sigma factor (sigma-70 family)
MTEHEFTTELVENWLSRLRHGDHGAVNELIASAQRRMSRIAQQMLSSFPAVARWEDADDIVQEASLRLTVVLEQTPPTDAKHFFRLAARIMRRHLIDFARRYRGPQSHAAHHATQGRQRDEQRAEPAPMNVAVDTHDPQTLAQWTLLHERAHELPEELREVFDLMFYNGLKQVEVQQTLGLDAKTIRKRWLLARLSLQQSLDDSLALN